MPNVNDPTKITVDSRVVYRVTVGCDYCIGIVIKLYDDAYVNYFRLRFSTVVPIRFHWLSLTNSAFLSDTETGEELYIEWKNIWLIESYKEKRCMVMFGNPRSLRKGDDCLAIAFDDKDHKFAKGVYKEAILVKRMHSKLKVNYKQMNGDKHIVILKEIRVKDDVFPSVIKIIPAVKSMSFILMQNLLKSMDQDSSPNMPSPSASPPPSTSSSVEMSSTSKDTSQRLIEFNEKMLRESTDSASKLKKKARTACKIVSKTINKAKQTQNPNKKTAITFSTKFIFCLRWENCNEEKISQRAVWAKMKAEGYEVGKGRGINLWAQSGSQYYYKLMQERGDGAKYVAS